MQVDPHMQDVLLMMIAQTFAKKLWLRSLPRLICLTLIPGVDVWLLRQVHRTSNV
jgi:hypothetical protein